MPIPAPIDFGLRFTEKGEMNLMARRKSNTGWILASASPRRKEILGRLGLRFRIDPSGMEEPDRSPHETPSRYAVRLACLKGRESAQKHKSGFILSADTIVVLGSHILTKPDSSSDARRMIQQLSGRWHEVITGICVIDAATGREHSAFSRTRVHFRKLSAAEIKWYIKTGEYRDKAGAYGVQGYASLFIDRIEGCYFNIVGFPVSTFERLCEKFGTNLIQDLRIHNSKS
jgi:septum formation protein